jgi:hypothetical protein
LHLSRIAISPDSVADAILAGMTIAVWGTGQGRLRQIGRAALVPWWTAQLLTGTKSFERNGLIGNRRLNRYGLHEARVRLAHRVAQRRRRLLENLVSAADRTDFARDGFVVRHDFLPQAAFAELLHQVRIYRGTLREIAEGDTLMRKIALDRRALTAMPALAGVLRSPEWRGLIRYIGNRDAEPVVWIQSLSRHACDGPPDPQTFLHADTFHPTVKAWLFLTDVAADAGPFTYVPGSHRLTPRRLAWERRMSLAARDSADAETRQGSFRMDRDELRDMGLPEPRVFAVPANTLVVADTFGFHARGPSAGRSLRVEIWAYGRRSPFLPWAGFDPWTAAALARRSLIGWQLGDLLERAGIKPHRWRPRTGQSIFEPAAFDPA